MNRDPATLAEQLKDMAYDLGLSALRATLHTGPDSWMRVEVREAWLLSDSRDGWDVTVEGGGL